MKKIYLSLIALSLWSCAPSYPTSTKIKDSSVAPYHRRADIKKIFILIDSEIYALDDFADFQVTLREAISQRNIECSSHYDNEMVIQHKEKLQEKWDKFEPSHVLLVEKAKNEVEYSFILSSVNKEQNKEVWKGSCSPYATQKALAEAVISDLINKKVL